MGQNKYLLDTNVLLDGIFNPFSYSRRVLELISKGKLDAYVGSSALKEAQGKLKQFNNHGHLLKVFSDFLPKSLHVIADEVQGLCMDDIICATASKNKMKVCTKDIGDFRKRISVDQVLSPRDVVLLHAECSLEDYCKWLVIRKDRGAFHFGASHLNWSNTEFPGKDKSTFHFFDMPGFASCYYSVNEKSLMFEVEGAGVLKEKIESMKAYMPLEAIVTYNSKKGAAFYFRNKIGAKIESLFTWQPEGHLFEGQIVMGNDHLGQSAISGSLDPLYAFYDELTHAACNNIFTLKALPDPIERLPLESLIQGVYL